MPLWDIPPAVLQQQSLRWQCLDHSEDRVDSPLGPPVPFLCSKHDPNPMFSTRRATHTVHERGCARARRRVVPSPALYAALLPFGHGRRHCRVELAPRVSTRPADQCRHRWGVSAWMCTSHVASATRKGRADDASNALRPHRTAAGRVVMSGSIGLRARVATHQPRSSCTTSSDKEI
jgi:hypothetical protein